MREVLVTTSRTSARTDCRGGGGKAGQPLGTGEFGQFSLAGNRVEALHLATRVFLAGNNDEQRDKEQERGREKGRRNLRNLGVEILERSRGRRRKEIFNENQRKAVISSVIVIIMIIIFINFYIITKSKHAL